MKKKHGYSSKLTWLHTVYDWKSTKHNSIQKSVFQTLIFKPPKTDHQVLQKQQLNGARHSWFSKTLGQTIEAKETTKHKHLAQFTPSAPKYWTRHLIWFTNFKSGSKISSWKGPWTYRRNCLPGPVYATSAGYFENLLICIFHFHPLKRGDAIGKTDEDILPSS